MIVLSVSDQGLLISFSYQEIVFRRQRFYATLALPAGAYYFSSY